MADEPVLNPAEAYPAAQKSADQTAKAPPDPSASETNIPSSIEEKSSAQNGQANIREWWKVTIETFTLIAVVWYAYIAHGQLNGILESNKINRATYEAADRPYVGLNGISVLYIPHNATSLAQVTQEPTKETKSLSINAEIKDFGPVPGTEFTCGWRWFLNGVALKISKIPDFPSTIFPNQSVYLHGQMGSNNYLAVQSGEEILTIDFWTDYVGPSGHYTECQKQQYRPDNHAFIDIGEKCTQ